MAKGPIYVVGIMEVLPAKRDAFLGACYSLIRDTQKEDACIFYNVHQDLDDENKFLWIERWKSLTLMNQHQQTKHCQKFLRQLKEENLLKRPFELEDLFVTTDYIFNAIKSNL
eukprot:UN00291